MSKYDGISLLKLVVMELYGIYTTDAAQALNVTQPTMDAFYKDPMWMRGHHRLRLAALLQLPISTVDKIVNDDPKERTRILAKIATLSQVRR